MKKNFIPVTEILDSNTEISVTGPAQLFIHIDMFKYEHIKTFTKETVMRRDLANRARTVHQAHIKRPQAKEEILVVLASMKGKKTHLFAWGK